MKISPSQIKIDYPFIFNNCKFIGSNKCDYDLYHISNADTVDNFKVKIPDPNRAMKWENKSFPRISVAKTLNNCIIGYAAIIEDAIELKIQHGVDAIVSYSIYRFKNWRALIPNARLVPDVYTSNEYWIYQDGFECEKIGEILVTKIGKAGLTGSYKKYRKYGGDRFEAIIMFDNKSDAKHIFFDGSQYGLPLNTPNNAILFTSTPTGIDTFSNVDNKYIDSAIKNSYFLM